MTNQPPKQLGPVRRALGLASVVLVLLVGATVGFWVVSRREVPAPEPAGDPAALVGHVAFTCFFGALALGSGVGAYAVLHATRCLTMDWSRPVYRAFKTKLFLANIMVPLLVNVWIGFWVAMPTTPVLEMLGRPSPISLLTPLFEMAGKTSSPSR